MEPCSNKGGHLGNGNGARSLVSKLAANSGYIATVQGNGNLLVGKASLGFSDLKPVMSFGTEAWAQADFA